MFISTTYMYQLAFQQQAILISVNSLLQYFLTFEGADHSVTFRNHFKSLPDEFISGRQKDEHLKTRQPQLTAQIQVQSLSTCVTALITAIRSRQASAANASKGGISFFVADVIFEGEDVEFTY